jgi:hypothetical protein
MRVKLDETGVYDGKAEPQNAKLFMMWNSRGCPSLEVLKGHSEAWSDQTLRYFSSVSGEASSAADVSR